MVNAKKAWQDLSQLLDIHGLHQINDAKATRRAVWIFLLFAASAVLVYNLYVATSEFLSNPILTSYSFQSKSIMQFPNLYLCPFNPINKTVLEYNKYTNEKVDSILKEYLKGFQTLSTTESNTRSRPNDASAHFTGNSVINILAQKTTALEAFGTKLTRMGHLAPAPSPVQFSGQNTPTIQQWCETFENETIYDFVKRVGYSANEFVRECSFGAVPLDCEAHITPVFDLDHGKCFIFNMDGMAQLTHGVGLSLLLDAWIDLYPGEKNRISMFEGAMLKIEHFPDPTTTDTILLLPGQYTKIKISHKVVKIINNTLGQQKQSCSGAGRRLQVLKLNYSQTACRLDCLQIALERQCNCVLPFDPMFLSDNYKRSTPCSASNHSRCTSKILSSAEDSPQRRHKLPHARKDLQNCLVTCEKPCEAHKYSSTISSTLFPSKTYAGAYNIYDPRTNCQFPDQSEQYYRNLELYGGNLPEAYNCTWYQKYKNSVLPPPPLPAPPVIILPPPTPFFTTSPSIIDVSNDANRPPGDFKTVGNVADRMDNNQSFKPTGTDSTDNTSPPVLPSPPAPSSPPAAPSPPATPSPPAAPSPPVSPSPPATFPPPETTPDPCSEDLPPYHARYDTFSWSSNYILLDIAFEDMQIETIEQSPSMTFNMFLSNLGGQFGLWIGASLLTLIQLGVYLCSCCCQCKEYTKDDQRAPFSDYSPHLSYREDSSVYETQHFPKPGGHLHRPHPRVSISEGHHY